MKYYVRGGTADEFISQAGIRNCLRSLSHNWRVGPCISPQDNNGCSFPGTGLRVICISSTFRTPDKTGSGHSRIPVTGCQRRRLLVNRVPSRWSMAEGPPVRCAVEFGQEKNVASLTVSGIRAAQMLGIIISFRDRSCPEGIRWETMIMLILHHASDTISSELE